MTTVEIILIESRFQSSMGNAEQSRQLITDAVVLLQKGYALRDDLTPLYSSIPNVINFPSRPLATSLPRPCNVVTRHYHVRGLDAITGLFLVFLILKITGNIDWAWWWVLSPLWGIVALWTVFKLVLKRNFQPLKF